MTTYPNSIVRIISASSLHVECPVCDDRVADETGAPVFPEDPKFCSHFCRDIFVRDQSQKPDVEAAERMDAAVVIAAHNSKCARCVSSPTYCFHQEARL